MSKTTVSRRGAFGLSTLVAGLGAGLLLVLFVWGQVSLVALFCLLGTLLAGAATCGLANLRALRRLRRIADTAEEMAEGVRGGLTIGDNGRDEVGRMARAIDQLVEKQQRIVREIGSTTASLNSAAGQFLATARQQERGALDQKASIELSRGTLDLFVQSGREVGRTAQKVLSNAERTQRTATLTAERITELSRQVERISEILEIIRGIATKSEFLALNAALEGTRAGEAGRGFSLVAGRMQGLTGNVMDAIRDITELTGAIREATQSSVEVTEESTKLSADTTLSARQIALIIQQQEVCTDQVAGASEDVSRIASETAAASKQMVVASAGILALCEHLQELAGSAAAAMQVATTNPSTPKTGAGIGKLIGASEKKPAAHAHQPQAAV